MPTAAGGITALGLAQAFEGRPTTTYDAVAGTLTDSLTGSVYVAGEGRWVPRDGVGEPLPTGWRQGVGLGNYGAVLTDPVRSGFLRILGWNATFALLAVVSTFALGLLLALLFDDPRLRGRAVYRSVLVLPFAIPAFVAALVWRSMFNQDYGLVNGVTGLHLDWLGDPWPARLAVLVANLWLETPYMFVVCTAALQSIPAELVEAARIDGAGRLRMIRSVTLPLVLAAVGPLLFASFAFNFNHFSLVYLLTGGGPFSTGDTSVGATDLLVTYAYRLAFSGGSPDYGLAATVSVLIFAVVALLGWRGLRMTRSWEEVT